MDVESEDENSDDNEDGGISIIENRERILLSPLDRSNTTISVVKILDAVPIDAIQYCQNRET